MVDFWFASASASSEIFPTASAFASDVEVEAEAEAVGSGLFQRKWKQKGSFQIFASLPEAEAVFGLTEITMQITDELRMPLHWSTEGGTIFS